MDTFRIETTTKNMCNLFTKIVEMVRISNIVHMVSDNSNNYKVTRHLLCDKRPSILLSRCVTHCINLIMKDIDKLPHVKDLIVLASSVTYFIYN